MLGSTVYPAASTSGADARQPSRPNSAVSRSSSEASSLRDRLEVSHLGVNALPSAVPSLPSSFTQGRERQHPPEDEDEMIQEPSTPESSFFRSSTVSGRASSASGASHPSDRVGPSNRDTGSTFDSIHDAHSTVMGLGLAIGTEASGSRSSISDPGADEQDAVGDLLDPEEDELLSANPFSRSGRRNWGDDDVGGLMTGGAAGDDGEDDAEWGGMGRDAVGPDERVPPRKPSIAHMQSMGSLRGLPGSGGGGFPILPLAGASTATEEWRAKILESVRKGEEKVAQRRKSSLATMASFEGSKTPIAESSALPPVPDEVDVNEGEEETPAEPEADPVAVPSTPSPLPSSRSAAGSPSDTLRPAGPAYPPPDPEQLEPSSPVPSFHSQLLPRGVSRDSSAPSARSVSLHEEVVEQDAGENRRRPRQTGPPSNNRSRAGAFGATHFAEDPPPDVDGTFISVADPLALTRMTLGTQASPSGRHRMGKRGFLSTLLHRATAGSSNSPSSHIRSASSPSLTQEPFCGYSLSSQSPAPTVTSRTRVGASGPSHQQASSRGMARSASDGAALTRPLGSTNPLPLGIAPPGPSVIRVPAAPTPAVETTSLRTLGLTLTPLTPVLSLSRYAQPLCGAILDQKYLLVGTTAGLDFLPLQHVVTDRTGGLTNVGTSMKPISLIKKTRFRSLEVLEVRSNILLAIAGRNNHLRVYALEGIRAIINKRVNELIAKDEYVWLSKPVGSIPNVDKGKSRASAPQPRQVLSAQEPPPYTRDIHATNESACDPSSRLGLKRSTTLRETRVGPTRPSTSVQRSSSVGGRSRQSSRNPAEAPAAQPNDPSLRTQEPRRQGDGQGPTVELGLEKNAENEDSPAGGTPGSSSNEIERSDPTPRRGAGSGGKLMPREAVARVRSMNELAQMLSEFPAEMEEKKRAGPAAQRRTAHGSKLVPRGAVAGISGMGELAAMLAEAEVLAPPGESTPRKTSRLTQARFVPKSSVGQPDEEGEVSGEEEVRRIGRRKGSTTSPIKTQAGAPLAARQRRPSSATTSVHTTSGHHLPRLRPQPRSPTTRQESEAEPPNEDDESCEPQMRQPSLAEILAEGPPPHLNGAPPLPSHANARAMSASRRSLASTDADTSLEVTRRKRWSVIDSVFRPGTAQSQATTSQNGSSMAPHRRASVDGVASLNEVLDDQLPDDENQSPERVGARAVPTASTSGITLSAPAPPLRTSRSMQKIRPHIPGDVEETTRERLATHASEESSTRTAPHPATLGAPLEYVKLARTKGARLLRAVETKRRTYLAVLCGENGERVELFTGSKNISLSLNRTFVLPETPRTIEFQMQGDDLVDIYLVYDESVFALEPATVRVREVGIGRNERRAARRERERAARDAASQNIQPGLATPRPPGPADPPRRGLGTEGGSSESMTIASGSAPAEEDDGLSLAPPAVALPPRAPANTSVSAGATTANEPAPPNPPPDNPPTTDGSATAWPYTTFQQLSFIPPLPPAVLGSNFVIPPTYETVVSAGSALTAPPTSRMTAPGVSANTWFSAGTPPASEAGPASARPVDPNGAGAPLLSPISLLATPAARQIGPPGLFFVSRGKKITAIVDCDGRSVLKRPFLWQSKSSKPEEAVYGLRRVETIVSGQRKTIIVGLHATGVKAAEIGLPESKGSDEWSNLPPLNVVPPELKVNPQTPREVTFLGTSRSTNEVIWSDRVGNSYAVYALSSSA